MRTHLSSHWRWLLACAGLAITISGPMRAAGSGETTLAVSGRTNANVSLAAEGAFVAAVWSAAPANGSPDVFASVSRDNGATFSTPVRVNSTPGDVSVNGEQPPRVALSTRPGASPSIAVVWTTKGAQGTRLVTARSTDAGRTFTATTSIAGGDAAGNRGWEAIAAAQGGRFFVAWLDHRKLAKPQESAVATEHHHTGGAMPSPAPGDGAAMAQLSQLYVSSVDDPKSVRAVTGGVCYCCKTAILTKGSTIYLAWRHVYPGNMRDIAFSMSTDNGLTFSTPVRISEDKWQLDGCPDDGPSMALDAGGRIHVVWPTLVQEKDGPVKALFHASSADGKAFTPRDRVPTRGQANHPQLAATAAGSLTVVWDESGSGTRHLALATAANAASGQFAFVRDDSWSSRLATYPEIATTSTGSVIAWTAGGAEQSVIKLARR